MCAKKPSSCCKICLQNYSGRNVSSASAVLSISLHCFDFLAPNFFWPIFSQCLTFLIRVSGAQHTVITEPILLAYPSPPGLFSLNENDELIFLKPADKKHFTSHGIVVSAGFYCLLLVDVTFFSLLWITNDPIYLFIGCIIVLWQLLFWK